MIVFMNLRHEGNLMAKKAPSLDFFVDGIHHMDCLEGMKQLPDESIDLVITSPPYADMRAYEGGFEGFHPDKYVAWFLPYVAEISRILKPTGSFILNINDKASQGFRHPFVFELIFAIHNANDYCKLKEIEPLDMNNLRLFERLFWNKGKFLPQSNRFGDKVEYIFWFSKTDKRVFNIDRCALNTMKKVSNECNAHSRSDFVGNWMTRLQNTNKVERGPGRQSHRSHSWNPHREGAMNNVKLVTENLPEGTVLILERGDTEYNVEWYEVVKPVIGQEVHPSTEIKIGSRIKKNCR